VDKIKNITQVDRLIHEPSRLAIIAVLSACESADFNYLLNATDLTKGNLSSHLKKLDEADYIKIKKGFKGNYPYRTYSLTKEGRKRFGEYKQKYLALAKELEADDNDLANGV
jgi:DNA-binding MarR family transcriptional regulator